MSELSILKEKLGTDPLFHALFNKSDSAPEAIRLASSFGVNLSIEDINTYRKELRAMSGKQPFHLDFARPKDSSWSFGGWGDDGGGVGEGGCSDLGGGCSSD